MIYRLTTRPHIGCGCARTIYEIRDATDDHIVRTQISVPSAQDCEDAVRQARTANVVPFAPLVPAGGAGAGRRSRRTSRVDLYNL